MSYKISALVWDGFPQGGTLLLAMLALSEWADDQGVCFPSINSIAKRMRVQRRQAQHAMSTLRSTGFVQVIKNASGGPPGSSCVYQLNLEKLRVLGTGVQKDTGVQNDAGTGVQKDMDGCHFTSETGVQNNALTVIEPSKNRQPLTADAVPPDCPHEEIIALYHQILPSCPRVKSWTEKRRGYLKARWREDKKRQRLAYWEKYFGFVSKSEFLTGNTPAAPNRKKPFVADLEWLVIEGNFVKVIEGKYHEGDES